MDEGRVGKPDGCQGAARWLLGSAVAIGRVLKPLEALPYERLGGCGRAEDESWEDSPTVKQQESYKRAFHCAITAPLLTHKHTLT